MTAAPCACQLIDVDECHFCAELDRLYARYVWAHRHNVEYETERAAFQEHFFGAVRANRAGLAAVAA